MGAFEEPQAVDIAWQMLLAVNYIHSHGIVHRDLKLENFVYDKKGSNTLKMIDFGFGKVCVDDATCYSRVGTTAYAAPEVLDNKDYDSKCDLWSLGVIVYALLTGG